MHPEGIQYVKNTKTPLRNLQHPLWLHNDALETPKRWSTFQDGIDMKIYMQLSRCFLGTSNMSNTTNTPLRNLQHPRRLQGGHLEDTLKNQRVGPLASNAEIWKFIHSFLDVILQTSNMSRTTKTPLRNLQRPLRLQDDVLETHRRLSTFQECRDLKSLSSILDVSRCFAYAENNQNSSQEPPVSS